MFKKKSDVIYKNRTDLEQLRTIDHTDCGRCSEDLVFAMKDNHHQFSIGMTTILRCLAMAEKDGYVPKLPDEWWMHIHNRYY